MIGALDDHEFFRFRQRVEKGSFTFCREPNWSLPPWMKNFGLRHSCKIGEATEFTGSPEPNQVRNALVLAAHAQAQPTNRN